MLVALWVSDWSQYRADRGRERTDLAQLLSTTRENEARIQAAIEADSSALDSARRLLALLHAPGALPSEDTLSALRFGAFRFSVFFPMTGTYAALGQTGDLNLIRDDSLRAQVAAYAGEMDGTARQLEDWTATFHRNVEALIRTAPFDRVREAYFGERVASASWRTEALQRALYLQTIISTNRLLNLRQLLASTRALRERLERVVGTG